MKKLIVLILLLLAVPVWADEREEIYKITENKVHQDCSLIKTSAKQTGPFFFSNSQQVGSPVYTTEEKALMGIDLALMASQQNCELERTVNVLIRRIADLEAKNPH